MEEAMAPKLQVVVGSQCPNCNVARRVAGDLARAIPQLEVEIIDLDVPGTVRPAATFAVPTFLLNGRILWLGNPTLGEAIERLKELLHEHQANPLQPGRT